MAKTVQRNNVRGYMVLFAFDRFSFVCEHQFQRNLKRLFNVYMTPMVAECTVFLDNRDTPGAGKDHESIVRINGITVGAVHESCIDTVVSHGKHDDNTGMYRLCLYVTVCRKHTVVHTRERQYNQTEYWMQPCPWPHEYSQATYLQAIRASMTKEGE